MVETSTVEVHEIVEDNITVEEDATTGITGTKKKRPRNRKARGRGRGGGKVSQSQPELGPEPHLPPTWNHGPGQFSRQQSWVPNHQGYPPHSNWTHGHFQQQLRWGASYVPQQLNLNLAYDPLQHPWYHEPYRPWNGTQLPSQPHGGDLASVTYYNSYNPYPYNPYLPFSSDANYSDPVSEQLLIAQPLEGGIDWHSGEPPITDQSLSGSHTSNGHVAPDNGQPSPVNSPRILPNFSRKFKLIDTEEKLGRFLTRLQKVPKHTEEIYIDCEGDNLPKTLSTVQVHFRSSSETFLLDVTVLRAKVFEKGLGKDPPSRSFRQILGDPEVPIGIFGGEHDSYALFKHYRIAVKSPLDLQIMGDRIREGGDYPKEKYALIRCVDDSFVGDAKDSWKRIKENGKNYCKEHGFEVFEQRPLRQNLQEYAAGDVQILPHLHSLYKKSINGNALLLAEILALSQERIDNAVSTSLVDDSRRHCYPSSS